MNYYLPKSERLSRLKTGQEEKAGIRHGDAANPSSPRSYPDGR